MITIANIIVVLIGSLITSLVYYKIKDKQESEELNKVLEDLIKKIKNKQTIMSTEKHDEKRLEDNIYYRRLLQEINKENPNVELLKFLDSKIK